MFEKEEEKLNELRKHLEHVEIPQGDIDGAILQGMERAKREKQVRRTKRKKGLWTLAVSAIVLITLVSSIRVSPAFANAVASVPGLERFVELITHDKGIQSAIENDYFVPLNLTQTKGNLTLTINGYIVDRTGIIVFHTLHSSEELSKIQDMKINLEIDGVEMGSSGYDMPRDETEKIYESNSNFSFREETDVAGRMTRFDFSMRHEGENKSFELEWELPERLPKGEIYELNKTVEVEGQKITFKRVTIQPLRTKINVSFDKDNEMDIRHFENMRIVNEKGEEWGRIMNGTTATRESEYERSYYFQSNYFVEAEELYVKFSKMQALSKEELELVVDVDNQEILNQPEGFDLRLSQASRIGIEIHLYGEKFPYGLFSEVTDVNDTKIDISSSGFSNGDEYNIYDVQFKSPIKTSVVHLPLSFFPNYIYGETSIQIK